MPDTLIKDGDFITAVLRACGAVVVVFDVEGRIVFCNQTFERLFGYSTEEVGGKSFFDFLVSPERREQSREHLVSVISQRVPSSFENEWITKAGERRRISFSNVPLLNDAGEAQYYIVTGIDISDGYRATQELLRSETQFRSIWEGSSEPMLLTGGDGAILKVNAALAAMAGASVTALQGQNVEELFHDDSREAIRQCHQSCYASESSQHFFEHELHFAGGRSGIFETSLTRVEISRETPQMLCILHEVTEQKRNAIELARAKENAEAANRELLAVNRNLEETGRLAREMADRAEALSAAKTDFLANMTHEFRTPLNGILGMTGLALETKLESDQREYLELVKSSAESLLGMVNDVLDFSKYEVGKLALDCVEFSLRSLVQEVLRPMALRATATGIAFETCIEDRLPDRLLGDPLRISQILRNLAGNAVKFTKKGHVSVKVRAESIEGTKITLCFSVADTGIGIPAEKHRQVFEPFTQADSSTTRQYGGTGLGLSISSGLVELMGGRIWVESELGRGSTFYFTLQLDVACPALAGGRSTPHSVKESAKQSLRILVAEDNSVNQRLAVRLLEREGHSVTIAASGQEAVDAFERNQSEYTRFNLILMDLQMPGLDGLEATARIRRRENDSDRRVPIVAMTAQATEADRLRCLEAGMDAYLTKPVDVPELLRIIESVAPGGDSMNAPLLPAESSVELQLHQLDETLALSRVGGDIELLKEVVELFLEDYPSTFEKIKKAVAAHDAGALEHSAHSLKGSVSTFGANRAFEAAFALEKQGRSGDLADVQNSLLNLEQALEALRPELVILQTR